MNVRKNIPFSPPDITDEEINEVVDALKSGWITTGPKTKELEANLKSFCGASGFACFSSATTALESTLRILGIEPGDEVITSAYTYTASASPAVHVGAKLVLVDIASDGSFEMDYDALAEAITPNTKAIIPVDLGGCICDYERIFEIVNKKSSMWNPKPGTLQEHFTHIPVVSDDAHALGAIHAGAPTGSIADFSTFSFHAVKNFTTAEGGAVAWKNIKGVDNDWLYHQFMLMQLHGQSKDALSKNKPGAWEYDIEFPGYKCNMTDIQAAVGLAQLRRYPTLLARRREMIESYERKLASFDLGFLPHYTNENISSGHLMVTHLNGKSLEFRNELITRMAEKGVATNVHYKPLPLFSAYKNLGFDITNYPNSYAYYENEITLPLNTCMSDEDLDYVCEVFAESYKELCEEGIA